jgi:uncharacterized membrane protein YqjE
MTETDAHEPPVLALMKEVVDALGTLIAGHLRLARAELGEEARRHVRRGAYILVAATLIVVGYAFTCLAAALALGRMLSLPVAVVLVGGLHLVGASFGMWLVLNRRPARAFDESISALDRTVTTLAVSAEGLTRGGSSTAQAGEGAPRVLP